MQHNNPSIDLDLEYRANSDRLQQKIDDIKHQNSQAKEQLAAKQFEVKQKGKADRKRGGMRL